MAQWVRFFLCAQRQKMQQGPKHFKGSGSPPLACCYLFILHGLLLSLPAPSPSSAPAPAPSPSPLPLLPFSPSPVPSSLPLLRLHLLLLLLSVLLILLLLLLLFLLPVLLLLSWFLFRGGHDVSRVTKPGRKIFRFGANDFLCGRRVVWCRRVCRIISVLWISLSHMCQRPASPCQLHTKPPPPLESSRFFFF